MKSRGWLALALALLWGQPAAAMPDYADYPAKIERMKARPKLDISDPDIRHYRTRLREAVREGTNFAGHYAFGVWGCGMMCAMGGAVDTRTGKAFLFPGTVCCFMAEEDGFEYFNFRADSRLLITRGMHNEDDRPLERRYYYLDERRGFVLVGIEVPDIDNHFPIPDEEAAD
jgi:hypothetical protein